MLAPPETIKRRPRYLRLFLDETCDHDEISLSANEAHYLRNVLRAKPGQSVIVFDGEGNERVTEITQLTKTGGRLHTVSTTEPLPESQLQLRLLQAIAKSEAMDLIVQKATELGVREIQPLISEFCVVRLDAQRGARRLEHWQRIARSACEQCGRHTPPRIAAPRLLEQALIDLPAAATRLALDPYAGPALTRYARDMADASPCYLLVGPEGGLSERDLLSADRVGFERVQLGPRVLRVETAAVAACTLAQAQWGDLR